MINIAICDDSVLMTGRLEQMLLEIAEEQHLKIDCKVFFDGSTLVHSIIHQNNCFELIFLDIEMKTMSGIQAASILREMDIASLIVYVSAYEKYLKDILSTQPFSFISKPVNQDELRNIFLSAYKKICKSVTYYTFTYKKNMLKIPLNQIIYFESYNRMVFIHPSKANSLSFNQFYGKLNDVETQIANTNNRFLRIHQSYLINFDYIKSIAFTNVTLMDETKLYISEHRQKKIHNLFRSILNFDEVRK